MDYAAALEWLYGTQRFGVKLGLANSRRLNEHFQLHPAGKAFVFHVAGTNGKGSVCAFLESLLLKSGAKVGLLTSPHLIHFRERIRIQGIPVSDALLLEKILAFQHQVASWDPHPTFFELTTAIALQCMLEEGVDAILLETGLGGRLDSTNATDSDIGIITSIALDHMSSLGNTLREIAREKAGILQPGKPMFVPASLPEEALTEIKERSRALGCSLRTVSSPLPREVRLGLVGAHQAWNAALALHAFQASPFSLPERAAHQALEQTQWSGRFQRVSWRGRTLVLDGAHNPAAAAALVDTWRDQHAEVPCHLVFGTVRDKEAASMLEVLRPIAQSIHLTSTPTARGYSASELSQTLAQTVDQVEPDLETCLESIPADSAPILITGSLYLVGWALEHLLPNQEPFEPSLQ